MLMRSGVGVDPEIARIVDETRARFIDRLTSGFGQQTPQTPIGRLALRGWVGFAEAASLGWSEAIAAGAPSPDQAEVRALLSSAFDGDHPRRRRAHVTRRDVT